MRQEERPVAPRGCVRGGGVEIAERVSSLGEERAPRHSAFPPAVTIDAATIAKSGFGCDSRKRPVPRRVRERRLPRRARRDPPARTQVNVRPGRRTVAVGAMGPIAPVVALANRRRRDTRARPRRRTRRRATSPREPRPSRPDPGTRPSTDSVTGSSQSPGRAATHPPPTAAARRRGRREETRRARGGRVAKAASPSVSAYAKKECAPRSTRSAAFNASGSCVASHNHLARHAAGPLKLASFASRRRGRTRRLRAPPPRRRGRPSRATRRERFDRRGRDRRPASVR